MIEKTNEIVDYMFFLNFKDGNGFIDVKELRRVFNNLGEKLAVDEIENLIADFEADGDGRVNYAGTNGQSFWKLFV